MNPCTLIVSCIANKCIQAIVKKREICGLVFDFKTEAKTLIRNKRLADLKHRNGGYNPQQDTLRLLSRHKQTMIFRLRTGHCRLLSHMKKIGIEKSAVCPCRLETKPKSMPCSHALSTKEKEKAPGQQKVPQETNSMEYPQTYAWRCGSSP